MLQLDDAAHTDRIIRKSCNYIIAFFVCVENVIDITKAIRLGNGFQKVFEGHADVHITEFAFIREKHDRDRTEQTDDQEDADGYD